jgi:hypothetical protein
LKRQYHRSKCGMKGEVEDERGRNKLLAVGAFRSSGEMV